MKKNRTEQSKIWRNEHFPSVELLSASYTKFQFTKHWHDELAIGVIEEGAEGLLYRGDNLVIPKKHIVAINSGEIHTGFAGTDSGWRYRMFYFDVKALAEYCDDYSWPLDPIVNLPIIDDGPLFDMLLGLHVSLEQSALSLTKDSLLTLALGTLFDKYGAAKCQSSHHLNLVHCHLVKDYLEDNFDQNPSLEELASLADNTKFQLISHFKRLFGVPPHQYLLQLKVRRAKQLLMQGMSCVDVSLTCGFYDQSHFSRNFKKAFGVSPSNYLG